jgi:hypothetical protein
MRNDRRLVDFEFALALNIATGKFLSASILAGPRGHIARRQAGADLPVSPGQTGAVR